MRNLKADISEEQLKEKFETFGKIERVKKIKDYGFVHFEERDAAIKAMNEMNGVVSNDSVVDVYMSRSFLLPPHSMMLLLIMDGFFVSHCRNLVKQKCRYH